MATITHRIVDNLRDALVALEAERDADLERVRLLYQTRIESIEQAIAAVNGSSNGNGVHRLSMADSRPPVPGAISDERLEAVREYIHTHSPVRQADIGPALDFNSGTISVATRILEENQEIRPLSKKRGSQVWEYVSVPAPIETSLS